MAGHRYWRIINIKCYSTEAISAVELRFINDKNIDSNNPALIAQPPPIGNQPYYRSIANAVDGYINTFSESSNYGAMIDGSTKQLEHWISYDFQQNVTVTAIKNTMRQDKINNYQDWVSCNVEYSDNNTDWVFYGKCIFDFQPKETKTVSVLINTYKILGKSLQDDNHASRFVLINDWQTGDFVAKVTPQANGDWEYRTLNANKLIISHIGAEGFAPRIDAPIIPVAI